MGNSIYMLGAEVKSARLQAGKTRKELAAKLQVSARHLMEIENGRQKPSFDLLYRMVRELSIPVDRIFYPEEAHNRPTFEQASMMLRMCGDKELGIIVSLLQSLLDGKSYSINDKSAEL